MPIYPNAYYKPVPAHGGKMREHLGLVLHVQVGNNSCFPEFSNVSNQASSTWWMSRDGRCEQYVDSDEVAWAEAQGNATYDSVETEGFPSERLTIKQIQALADLYRWGAEVHGWPKQLAEKPGDRGLGWHGMGGSAWGGHVNCLPLDITEILTPNGWKQLAEATTEDEVASYAPDSTIIDFARPLAITPKRIEEVIEIAGFTMTPDHRLYVYRSDYPTQKVLTAQEAGKVRTNYLLPAQGVSSTEGCGIGPDLMRLLVWVQADGHYQVKEGRLDHLHFHFSKERKVARVREVLDSLDKPYKLSRRSDGTTVIKVYDVAWLRDNVLVHLPQKRWEWTLLAADADEFSALDNELMQADGYERPDLRTYSSTIQQNVDVLQALYVTHGHSAAVDKTVGGWTMRVHVRRQGHALRDRYRDLNRDTLVGCLTTHNDTLLIRQKGRVAVVGNCPGDLRKAQRLAILQGAVEPGMARPSFTPPPDKHEEETMDSRTITYPTGHKTVVGTDGAIFNADTPYFGCMFSLLDSEKQGFENVIALTAVDPNREQDGYVIWAQNGNRYRFDPALWADLQKKGRK